MSDPCSTAFLTTPLVPFECGVGGLDSSSASCSLVEPSQALASCAARVSHNVLIVKKPGDVEVAKALFDVALWLHAHRKNVFVEPAVRTEETAYIRDLPFLEVWHCPTSSSQAASADTTQPPVHIDLVVCIGGDGTLLWASNLFKTTVPPVISFGMGSLGFLSPFSLEAFPEALARVFAGGFHVTLRSRLVCTIIKARTEQQKQQQQQLIQQQLQQPPQHQSPKHPTAGSSQVSPAQAHSKRLQPVQEGSGVDASASSAPQEASCADLDACLQPSSPIIRARHYSLSAQASGPEWPGSGTAIVSNSSSVASSGSPLASQPRLSMSPHFQSQAHGRRFNSLSTFHSLRGSNSSGNIASKFNNASENSHSSAETNSLGLDNLCLAEARPHAVDTARESDDAYAAAALEAAEAHLAEDVESYVCMNEVIVDRGNSAYLTNLDCKVDGMLFTRVQADGIIVATPTGSTAYSLSAGGSMSHPEVPCMLFTPVCPHSLSFRPLLLPDSSTLQIAISPDSRGTNCASFDGRHRVLMYPGDSVLISMSRFPLPTICRVDATTDWFDGVRSVLQWNSRSASQKSFKPMGPSIGGAGTPGGQQTPAFVAAATAAAAAKREAFQAQAAAHHASPPTTHFLHTPHAHLVSSLTGVNTSISPLHMLYTQSAPPTRDTPTTQP